MKTQLTIDRKQYLFLDTATIYVPRNHNAPITATKKCFFELLKRNIISKP